MTIKLNNLDYLEPLSEATATTLEPLNLFNDDFILIDLDKDKLRFVAELRRKKSGSGFHIDPSNRSHSETGSGYAVKFFRRIPERRVPDQYWEKDGRKYIMGGTDYTALIIQHSWPADRIIWLSDEAKRLYQYLLLRFYKLSQNAIKAANFKVNKIVPKLPPEYARHETLPLAPYQECALSIALHQEMFALYMDQGTGKTPVCISRICAEGAKLRKETGKQYTALIVAPGQTRTNWANEFARFATVPGQTVTIRGDQDHRIRCVTDTIIDRGDCFFSACICSYESVVGTLEALTLVPWDLIILDESHYIKSDQTARWKAVKELRGCGRQRMILTGTPIANTPMDLWAQMEFLGEGMSGFMTFKGFKNFHGKWHKDQDNRERLEGLINIPLLQERLARISYQITKKDAELQLPEKVFDISEVYMTKRQGKLYVDLVDKIILEIEESETETKRLTADNILTRLLRLSQITSGHVKWDEICSDEGEVIRAAFVEQIDAKNPKVEGLIDLIKAHDDENLKTIVWAYYIEDVRIITKRFAEEGINFISYHKQSDPAGRVATVEEASELFNSDPARKIFVGNPASAAEGLNLLGYDFRNPDKYQTYCGHEVFFSQGWSATQRAQAEDRAHRRGTRRTVHITDLMVPMTIDQEIRERVTQKREMANLVQDVRAILNRVASTEVIRRD